MILRSVGRSVRQACRRVGLDPLTSLAVVASVALAVSLNSTIYSAVDQALLRPLPYDPTASLVYVGKVPGGTPNAAPNPISLPEFLDWRDRAEPRLAGLAASKYQLFTLMAPDGWQTIDGLFVTPNLPSLFGITPIVGRIFVEADGEPGRDQVVLLSESFWRSRYGASQDIVDKVIYLDTFGEPKGYRVIGVLPSPFALRFPKDHAVYVPLVTAGLDRAGPARRAMAYSVYGRLKPGGTLADAQSLLVAITEQLNREYPMGQKPSTPVVIPLADFFFGSASLLLWTMLASAGLVFSIACANVASLLLAAGAAREGEMAIRSALGGSRASLIRQLVIEYLVLAVIGGAVGLGLSFAGLKALTVYGPREIPRLATLQFEPHVFTIAAGLSVAMGLAMGWLPAWRCSGTALQSRLGGIGRSGRLPNLRVQQALMTWQLALVVSLLMTAAVLSLSVWRLVSVDLGFGPVNLSAVRVRFLQQNYGPAGLALQQAIASQVASVPEIRGVAWTSELPLSGRDSITFRLVNGETHSATSRMVDDAYLTVIGATLKTGRLFSKEPGSVAPGVVINDTMAQRYFAGTPVIGQKLFLDTWCEVVGVVADVREGQISSRNAPTIYWRFADHRWLSGAPWLVVRTDPGSAVQARLTEVLRSIAPELPVMEAEDIGQRVGAQTARTRFLLNIVSVFGLVSLGLGMVGVFALAGQSVSRRRREFGVRLTLGATRIHIALLVLRSLGLVIAVGIVGGLGAAALAGQWVQSLLFGVSPLDGRLIAAVIALLVCAVAAAAFGPTRTAVRTDPLTSIRDESM